MIKTISVVLILLFSVAVEIAHAQSSAFTYQGKLTDGGNPANAQYDFIFRLFDASGSQVGGDLTKDDVQVTGGVFTITLDFGTSPFTNGAADSLEIAVRPGASTGTYTTLTPRQPLTSSPYALKSSNASAADSLSPACVLCVTDSHIQTVDGSKVTGTVANAATATLAGNVTGVVGIANGGTGSPTKNFVDLSTDQSVTGNKTFTNAVTVTGGAGIFNGNGSGLTNLNGANITSNSVNSGSEYDIGGSRVFSIGDPFGGNLFAGQQAGSQNSTGSGNSFFGDRAGSQNTTGFNNTFIGSSSGSVNIDGSNNTFVGLFAGTNNVSGSGVTLIGSGANVGSSNLTFATAIGTNATVTTSNTVVLGTGSDTVKIPGNMSVTGSLTGTASSAVNSSQLGGISAANYARRDVGQTFTGNNIFQGDVSVNFGAFNGNGSGLTSLNAGAVNQGILPITFGGTGSSSKNFVDLSTDQTTIAGNKTFTGFVTGTFIGSGASLSNLNGAAINPATNITAHVITADQLSVVQNINVGAGILVNAGPSRFVSGTVEVDTLGSAGSTTLCRNASNLISSCSSSLKYKNNIASFSPGMAVIRQLRPITFNWKQDGMKDVGFGAEDVARVNPLFVTYNDKGQVEGVKYDRLSVAFVNAFKEQEAQIEKQQKLIESQQEQIDTLKALVCARNRKAAACLNRK